MRVTSVEFIKKYGILADTALAEPVVITKNGRDRLVLISAHEFQRLTRHEQKQKSAPHDEHPLHLELLEIGAHCSSLPDLESRPADDIMGYDEHGLPS